MAITSVVNGTKEHYDVYIGRAGRGSKGYFGNPFQIGRDGTRHEVIQKFEAYFLARLDSDPEYNRRILALKGKILGCFCDPLPCHGHVIAKWVDANV